jgi:hypothetical protein
MDLSKCYVIDIETNNLLSRMLDFSSFPYKLNDSAKLWCVSIRNVKTREVWTAIGDEITKEWMEYTLQDCEYLIAHNGIKFDFIALKLFGVLDYTVGYLDSNDTIFGRSVTFIDTLVLSRLLHPDRFGGHSLEAWGLRLGNEKTDFRLACIEAGHMEKSDPAGHEFTFYTPIMAEYCEQDTSVNVDIFLELLLEMGEYKGWAKALKMEKKLADLAVRRESLGFWFDKDLAVTCLEDLMQKMTEIENKIEPLLPSKPMGKTEQAKYVLPKNQFKKDGTPSKALENRIEALGGLLTKEGAKWQLLYEDKLIKLPYHEPLKTEVKATLKDLDHIKMYLMSLGWNPVEWRERDLTKDAKKQNLPTEKRMAAMQRWVKDTLAGKYREARLNLIDQTPNSVENHLEYQLHGNKPVRVPTSPTIRIGVEKELCPNLVALGDKVAFANDFALYLTYKHRKSSIAGGDIEDMDFDLEYPNTGYLANYREADGRIATPAIEIGANSHRYRHIAVANIPRASSLYGDRMRKLFGAGPGFVQFGFDYSSLENRVQAGYVKKYPGGPELGVALTAEKPNDLHCYSQDTEILTEQGWKTFGQLTYQDKVAQWDEGIINYVTPQDIIWQEFEGDMYMHQNKNIDQLVTSEHRVYIQNYKRPGFSKVITASELLNEISSDSRIPVAGICVDGEDSLEPNFLRLLVATQADGYLAKDCSSIVFTFVKEKKIERMLHILDSVRASFKISYHTRKGRTETIIRLSSSPLTVEIRSWLGKDKSFTSKFINLSQRLREIFILELKFWDGTETNSGYILDTTCQKSVDIVQAVSTSLGIKCTKTEFDRKTNFGMCHIWRAFISKKALAWSSVRTANKGVVPYKGFVGCVTVPSSFVVVRRNGKTFVSGNSVNSRKLGISRTDAKSIGYAALYGASGAKLGKMLGKTTEEGVQMHKDYWDAVPALKQLKENLLAYWEQTGKTYIPAIDGRKLNIRSPHSAINSLFQSCGVICAKYVSVMLMQELEQEHGLCIDPFEDKPDVCSMIEYHDEQALACHPRFFKFELFDTEDEAKAFFKDWKGPGQLGAVTPGKKWYVALPSIVSLSIESATAKVQKMFRLEFELGFEYTIGKNWYETH